MKKFISALISVILIFTMAFAMVGCKKGDDGVSKIGIAMPTKSLERWNRDGTFLKDEFEKKGYTVELKYSDNNVDQQVSDIENLIADDVDVLIVAAIDGESLTKVLDTAAEKEIPVISYDRLIMNTEAVSYYVSFDNYTVGKLQGEYVVDALGLDLSDTSTTYNIEFTAGDPADNNAGFFFNGAFDVLSPYIDAGILNVVSGQTDFEQVATASWSTETAMTRMQNILASYYSDGTVLDVALCSNDSTALGVTNAIASDYAGTNTVIITGQDGDEANLANIVDGLQSMTVFKAVANEAVVTVAIAELLIQGKTPDAALADTFDCECAYDTSSYDNGTGTIPSYLLVPSVVTVDNIEEELVTPGYYVWSGEYPVAAG
ncbi:MAG: sugar ABC transporter substrate-binding protein [Clostridiaceae bacterium]|nr:sugar ABC transporter substrate-binding protein [Clostridiaceae bacterium]